MTEDELTRLLADETPVVMRKWQFACFDTPLLRLLGDNHSIYEPANWRDLPDDTIVKCWHIRGPAQ